jgi:nucleoside-diphosphate-sugar epimerase
MGYSARVIARRLLTLGWRVGGTARNDESLAALREDGFDAFLFTREDRDPRVDAEITRASHLLSSIPPDESGDPVLDRLGPVITRNESLEWVGYLSTTGVYGSRDGGWVDEESELRPTSERSRRRAAAEQGWLVLHERWGLPVHLFRLAGIYGPGRNTLRTVREGKAKRIDLPGQVFSRIHVEDIAAVLQSSIARPNPGAIYNVCDDAPAEPAKVVGFACGLLSVPPPPLLTLEEADLSPMALSFYRDNKRVSNRRIHEELGVRLTYPDYESGLRALYEAGE